MLECALACLLATWCLASCGVAAVVDARTRRIPNAAVLSLALCAAVQMGLCHAAGLAVLVSLGDWQERLMWSAALLAVGCAAEFFWRALHGGEHGMGLGDVKLLAAMALWLGPAVLVVLVVACAAAVVANLALGRKRFAFGPYLATSFGACLLLTLLGVPAV